jgi:hypothetical protein
MLSGYRRRDILEVRPRNSSIQPLIENAIIHGLEPKSWQLAPEDYGKG